MKKLAASAKAGSTELTAIANSVAGAATEVTLQQIATSVAVEGAVLLGNEFAVTNAGAVEILPANPNRRGIIIQNNGTANVRVGPVGVTATSGVRLIPNAIMTASPPFLPINAYFAIAEVGPTVVFATEIV